MSAHRLSVMRHAKSDWYSAAADDFLHPLSPRGRRDAARMGRWLAEQGLLPAHIVSSPAVRTRETLDVLEQAAGVDLAQLTEWIDELYHGSLEALLDILTGQQQHPDLMLLGHNPGVEDLVRHLLPAAGRDRGFSKSFPTGAIYVLSYEASRAQLESGCAALVVHQRPKTLPDAGND